MVFEANIDDKGVISFIPAETLENKEVNDIHSFMDQFSPLKENWKIDERAIQYLTKQQLLEINILLKMVGRNNYGGLSEFGLDMVVEAPKQIVFGHELYPIIWLKAAFILQKMTKTHLLSWKQADFHPSVALLFSLKWLQGSGY